MVFGQVQWSWKENINARKHDSNDFDDLSCWMINIIGQECASCVVMTPL